MATDRITIDVDQRVPQEAIEEVLSALQSYTWGFVQSNWDFADDRGDVTVKHHQHDPSGGACPDCVVLATDDKN